MNLHSNQRDEDSNNGRNANKYARSLAPNNPGIFIFKYEDLHIKVEKHKEDGIYTHKIYSKDIDGEIINSK